MRPIARLLTALTVLALVGCGAPQPAPGPDPPGTVVIRDVTVVDVAAGSLRPHSTVTVQGSRIVGYADASEAPPSAGAVVIEGTGRYLTPGLWDMHSHSLWSPEAVQTFLPLYVANGVTGIRDMGGQLPMLAQVRDSMRTQDPLWPRVVASGTVLDGAQPVQPDISTPVSDAASARAAVDSLARAGVDFIKVYTLLPREAYFAVMAEARRVGLPVAGHVPADVTVAEAARAGQSSIEHLRDEIELFCSPRDVDACGALADAFRRNKTWQVPTLSVLRSKAFSPSPGSRPTHDCGTCRPACARNGWRNETASVSVAATTSRRNGSGMRMRRG